MTLSSSPITAGLDFGHHAASVNDPAWCLGVLSKACDGFSPVRVEHSEGARVAEPSLSIVHIIALSKQIGYLTPKLVQVKKQRFACCADVRPTQKLIKPTSMQIGVSHIST